MAYVKKVVRLFAPVFVAAGLVVRLFAPLGCLYSGYIFGDCYKSRCGKCRQVGDFLCAAKNGSAESLRLPLWSAPINGFRCCIIYVNRRNMYLSHTLRRWVFGSRCRRLFFLSQRLASRAFVRTNAERRRAVRTDARRLSCFKGTPPNPRNALRAN